MRNVSVWTEKLTPEILRELENTFNFDFSLTKQKFSIELTVDIDRTDQNIALSIKDFNAGINKFAKIVGCSVEDLDIYYNIEKSDQEVVTHSLNVDNQCNTVGYYAELKSDIYKIIGYEDGVYTLQKANDEKNVKQASLEYLKPVSWKKVFEYISPTTWSDAFDKLF